MINNRDPRFIFIHIPKTGGTSIEVALANEILGKRLNQISREQSFQYKLPSKNTTHQHFNLKDYQIKCGARLSTYFIFAFVRNPWDLVVSEILYFVKHERRTFRSPNFSENVRKLLRMRGGSLWGHSFLPQSEFLKDTSGKISTTFIGRFEQLQSDYERVCAALALPKRVLPWVFRTNDKRPHYSHFFDEETRELVATNYREDIERFNYAFEEV